jgi:CBS domain-containing protein
MYRVRSDWVIWLAIGIIDGKAYRVWTKANDMQEPTVADMSIADEHIVVETKTRISAVCEVLSNNPSYAIIVKKGDDILGVVTARDIFSSMAEGINATKVKVNKIMRTDILTISAETPLSAALEILSSNKPDAIVIIDSSDEYVGYFSAQDYREATRKLETHQTMSSRLNRSHKAISKRAEEDDDDSEDDLLDLLLGDFEDDDEEDVKTLPSIDL